MISTQGIRHLETHVSRTQGNGSSRMKDSCHGVTVTTISFSGARVLVLYLSKQLLTNQAGSGKTVLAYAQDLSAF